MKIGIIGSGDVAKALAKGFLGNGHQVMFGTRTSAKLADWIAQNPGAQAGGVADAAAFGELVVLAVKGTAALEALRSAGRVTIGRQNGDGCHQPQLLICRRKTACCVFLRTSMNR